MTFRSQLVACESDSAVETLVVREISEALDQDLSLVSVAEVLSSVINQGNPLESLALGCLPLVLGPASHNHPGCKDILVLICHHASPREVLLVLDHCLTPDHPTNYDGEDGDDDSELETLTSRRLDPRKVLLALEMYTLCIPRMPIRKRTPSQILVHIADRLENAITNAAITQHTSPDILGTLIAVADSYLAWATSWKSDKSDEDLLQTKALLTRLLLKSAVVLSEYIRSDICQRALQRAHPRYTLPEAGRRQSSGAGDKSDHDPYHGLTQAFWSTSYPTLDPFADFSGDGKLYLGGLILATEAAVPHSGARLDALPLPSLDDNAVAHVILPALASSTCLKHVLAFLALETAPNKACPLQDTSMSTLINVLVPLASAQPDPTIRHISFRILSSLIDRLSDEALKLNILVELISNSPFPQMRAAAITLLRSTILSSLAQSPSSSASSASLFSTPHVLNTVDPMIFRLEPENIFQNYSSSRALDADNLQATREFINEFSESPQAVRITEALNFYYILLSRDQTNMTGIRSVRHLRETKSHFLDPLHNALSTWAKSTDEAIELTVNTHLSRLYIALERIDTEIKRVVFVQ